MPRLLEDQPSRALAIYAHPDDLEISCGGTIARWVQGGGCVGVVICTRGEKGAHDPATDTDRLGERRAREAQEAAEVLGVSGVELLGYDDGTVENDAALRERLVAAIRRFRPDYVVAPDPTATFFGSSYVNHHDHRAVGWATLDACAPAAGSPLYFPAAGEAHAVSVLLLSGTLEPDAWIDVTASVEVKASALHCHRSQLGDRVDWVDDWVKRRAAEEGARVGVPFAESYRYVRLQP